MSKKQDEEARLRRELDDSFSRWEQISKEGCSDPFWPDGVNMNLVRNHIIYYYRQLKDIIQRPVQLSLFEGGMDLKGERPIPPRVPDNYMVRNGKHANRLKGRYLGEFTYSMKGENTCTKNHTTSA